MIPKAAFGIVRAKRILVKRYFLRLLLKSAAGCLAVLGIGITPVAGQEPAGLLEVRFLDVGQADAMLIRCPDGKHFLLIDAGDTRYPGSAAAFQEHLKREFSGKPQPWKLAAVIASHPHSDHIGSMPWVLDTFAVGTYVDNGQKYESALWARLDKARQKLVKQGKLTYVNGKKTGSAELEFCPNPKLRVEVFVPWAAHDLSHTNDRSVIVRVTYDKTSFLFVGDAEAEAERAMVDDTSEAARKRLDVDVLKVGHHGSDTSSTPHFVLAVSPAHAVVSSGKKQVGTNARYKHPRLSTMVTYANWFKTLGDDAHALNGRVWAFDAAAKSWKQHVRRKGTWLTTADGTVTIRSDGERILDPQMANSP